MDEKHSERDLIHKAVAGDGGALKQLLLARCDRLIDHLNRRIPADLRRDLSGEDVCQEAWLTAFQQIRSLRASDVRVFESWLYTIAENRLRDKVRERRAAKRGGDRHRVEARGDESTVAELLELVAVDTQTPSRSVARHEIVFRVRSVLDQLRPDHREALRLHYLEGCTVAEAAERMQKTEGAVLMLCNRGLRAAAAILGDPAALLSRAG